MTIIEQFEERAQIFDHKTKEFSILFEEIAKLRAELIFLLKEIEDKNMISPEAKKILLKMKV